MTVFEKIKYLTKKRSKTMKQVTADLGYSENYFYSLKSGKQPSAEKLKELADYFNVSVDYLLDREKAEPVEDHKVQTIAAHIDDDVTEEQMEDILNYIEFIKQKHSKKD